MEASASGVQIIMKAKKEDYPKCKRCGKPMCKIIQGNESHYSCLETYDGKLCGHDHAFAEVYKGEENENGRKR